MAANGNALRSGIFIVSAALVCLAVVIVVSGPDRFASKTKYVAVFGVTDDLQGVRAGDEVRLGGVRVGNVKSVVVNTEIEVPDIRVTVMLPTKYVVREGATISVGGLIGSAWLNVDSLGASANSRLPEGGVIQGAPSALTRLSQLAPKLDAILADVKSRTLPGIDRTIEEYRLVAADARAKNLPAIETAANTARQLLEDVRAQITPIIERYAGVTTAAQRAATNIGDFVGPGDGPASFDFRKSLANVKDATGTAKEQLPIITEKVKTVLDQLDERLTQLKGTADDLRTSMANAREATGEIREILVDSRTRIDRIVASVEATTNNAKAFSSEVLRRPSRLIWRDDAKTQNNLGVYQSARQFAEGAQELNDAAAMLRDALRDPRITDEELKRRVKLLETSFDKFGTVEEQLYNSVKP